MKQGATYQVTRIAWEMGRCHAGSALFLAVPLLLLFNAISTILLWYFPLPIAASSAPRAAELNFKLIVHTAFFAVLLPLSSFIAAYWHRIVLLGEIGRNALPSFRTTVKYALNAFALWFAVVALLSIIFFSLIFFLLGSKLDQFNTHPPSILYGASSVLIDFLALLFGLRFSLKLPAIALDRSDMTFGRSWNLTSRQNLLFAALSALLTAIVSVEMFLGRSFLSVSLETYAECLYHFSFNFVAGVVRMLTAVAILSALYSYFVLGDRIPIQQTVSAR